GTSGPESVQLAPYTCPDLTPALDAGALVTGQGWVACSAPEANQGDNTLNTVLPRTGSTQALMTSGDAGLASPPNKSSGSGRGNNTGARGAYDVSIYRIDLNVPEEAVCLKLDYVFATEEYPENLGRNFNDGFLAQLDQNEWHVESASINASNNFARLKNGGIVSVNSAIFADPSKVAGPDTNGTEYDGMSQPLTASTPVTPGAHSIYLSIFDASDSALDSAVFLDNLRTTEAPCVVGSNQELALGNDNVTVYRNSGATTINVLANDSDPDGDNLTITGSTAASNGTASCNDTECTYTPAPGFFGSDSFTYTVSDGRGDIRSATVSITVENNPPNAVNDSASTAEDTDTTPINVLINDSDPDGDDIEIAGSTDGANGTVTCSLTSCTYTPDPDYFGTDTFTYTIHDGNEGLDTATVVVTVTPVNDAPMAMPDNANTIKNTRSSAINVLVNDVDVDGDTLTITNNTDGDDGTVTCTATSCTYLPDTGFVGTDTFDYTVSDGNGGTDTATVTVAVAATPPVILPAWIQTFSLGVAKAPTTKTPGTLVVSMTSTTGAPVSGSGVLTAKLATKKKKKKAKPGPTVTIPFTVAGGSAVVSIPRLKKGIWTISGTFAGNGKFNASASAPIKVNVKNKKKGK
ncbi:MAG TPA: Ig-like domain-containing protein, partial [Marmoricola sp.]|nr:Ig-like domain-containing protein [Marmoricola sp.]